MNNPLVTINILSYNRKEELRNTLTKVFEQDYKNIEVIVVDNASSDGTPEMVIEEFPQVELIELEKNIGIAGWNKGFEVAKGEFVLVLDDDSYPEKGTISIAIEFFKKNKQTGIVAFRVINETLNFDETENWVGSPFSFVGCGALISTNKIREVGYFDENLFIYLNELEMTARFKNAGYEVIFCKECVAIHSQSFRSRGNGGKNPFANKYRYEHYFWGMSYFLLTKFSCFESRIYFVKWIINRFLIAIFFFYYGAFFRSVRKLFAERETLKKNKKILKPETQKLYKCGNIFPLLDRDFFSYFKR